MTEASPQDIYNELNRRGLFTSDPEAAAIGHELRSRGVITDPTQGGLLRPAGPGDTVSGTNAAGTTSATIMSPDQMAQVRAAHQQASAARIGQNIDERDMLNSTMTPLTSFASNMVSPDGQDPSATSALQNFSTNMVNQAAGTIEPFTSAAGRANLALGAKSAGQEVTDAGSFIKEATLPKNTPSNGLPFASASDQARNKRVGDFSDAFNQMVLGSQGGQDAAPWDVLKAANAAQAGNGAGAMQILRNMPGRMGQWAHDNPDIALQDIAPILHVASAKVIDLAKSGKLSIKPPAADTPVATGQSTQIQALRRQMGIPEPTSPEPTATPVIETPAPVVQHQPTISKTTPGTPVLVRTGTYTHDAVVTGSTGDTIHIRDSNGTFRDVHTSRVTPNLDAMKPITPPLPLGPEGVGVQSLGMPQPLDMSIPNIGEPPVDRTGIAGPPMPDTLPPNTPDSVRAVWDQSETARNQANAARLNPTSPLVDEHGNLGGIDATQPISNDETMKAVRKAMSDDPRPLDEHGNLGAPDATKPIPNDSVIQGVRKAMSDDPRPLDEHGSLGPVDETLRQLPGEDPIAAIRRVAQVRDNYAMPAPKDVSAPVSAGAVDQTDRTIPQIDREPVPGHSTTGALSTQGNMDLLLKQMRHDAMTSTPAYSGRNPGNIVGINPAMATSEVPAKVPSESFSTRASRHASELASIDPANTQALTDTADRHTQENAAARQAIRDRKAASLGNTKEGLKAAGEAAIKRIKGRSKGRLTSGVDPHDIKDATIYLATRAAAGAVDAAHWAGHMIDMFGDTIRPHLVKIWQDGHELAKAFTNNVVQSADEFSHHLHAFWNDEGGEGPDFVGKFLEQDGKAAAEWTKNIFSQLGNSIIKATIPTFGVPDTAQDTLGVMRGDPERVQWEQEQRMGFVKDLFSKRSDEDNISFMDLTKQGKPQANADLQAIADMYRVLDDKVHAMIKVYNPDAAYLENHFRAMWKKVPGSEDTAGARGGRSPLSGSKGMLKQSTLATVSEGLAKGGELYSTNPQVLFEMAYGDSMRYIAARRALQDLTDKGLAVFVKTGDDAPDGFVKVADPISTVYYKSQVPTLEATSDTIRIMSDKLRGNLSPDLQGDAALSLQGGTKDGPMVKAGEYHFEDGTARLINNHLSKDWVREFGPTKGLLALKNIATGFELSFSAFHFIAEGLEAMGSGGGIAIRKLLNQKDFAGAGSELLQSLAAPYKVAKLGGDIQRYTMDKDEFLKTIDGKQFIKQYPEAEQMIEDLFHGGAKLSMHRDYMVRTTDTFKDNLKSGNYIGATLRAFPSLVEQTMKPLFEQFVPKIKAGQFFKEYSQSLAENQDKMQPATDIKTGEMVPAKLSRTTLARQTWDSIENRFGEMNFDSRYWNRTFKSTMQFMFRSVTWKYGNIAQVTSAPVEQMREFIAAKKDGRAAKITPGMAWLGSMAMYTAMIGSIVMAVSGTGAPQSAKDLVFPRTDPKDPDQRVAIPTMAKDIANLAHDPAAYGKAAESSTLGSIAEVMNNSDWQNVQIHNPDDPFLKQRWDDFAHAFKFPISWSTFAQSRAAGDPLAKQLSAFGITTKVPAWVNQTPAQQYAYSHADRGPAMSKDTAAQMDQIRAATKTLRSTPQDQRQDKIEAMVRAGKLTPAQQDKVSARLEDPQLVATFKHLGLSDALETYRLGNKQEREDTYDALEGKIDTATDNGSLSPAQQRQIAALNLK